MNGEGSADSSSRFHHDSYYQLSPAHPSQHQASYPESSSSSQHRQPHAGPSHHAYYEYPGSDYQNGSHRRYDIPGAFIDVEPASVAGSSHSYNHPSFSPSETVQPNPSAIGRQAAYPESAECGHYYAAQSNHGRPARSTPPPWRQPTYLISQDWALYRSERGQGWGVNPQQAGPSMITRSMTGTATCLPPHMRAHSAPDTSSAPPDSAQQSLPSTFSTPRGSPGPGSRNSRPFSITLPSREYVALSEQPVSHISQASATRTKLLVLDLNGALVFRDRGAGEKRKSFPRPYLGCFLDYLFLPEPTPAPAAVEGTGVSSETANTGETGVSVSSTPPTRPWEVFVWSSAQPHNVQAMVEGAFGATYIQGVWIGEEEDVKAQRIARGEGRLLGVWARDKMGLSNADYRTKVQTVKDLRILTTQLSDLNQSPLDPSPDHLTFGIVNTVLLDDSPLKAIHQPWSQIVLPEYGKLEKTIARAAAETEKRETDTPAASNRPTDPDMDDALLCVIGILEEMSQIDNVPAWIRSGGLTPNLPVEGQSVATVGQGLSIQLEPPTIENLPSSSTFAHWYTIPSVHDYWFQRGKAALARKGIECRHGIDPTLHGTPGGSSPLWRGSSPGFIPQSTRAPSEIRFRNGEPMDEIEEGGDGEMDAFGRAPQPAGKNGKKKGRGNSTAKNRGYSPSRPAEMSPSPPSAKSPFRDSPPEQIVYPDRRPHETGRPTMRPLPPRQETKPGILRPVDSWRTFSTYQVSLFLHDLSSQPTRSLTEEQRGEISRVAMVLEELHNISSTPAGRAMRRPNLISLTRAERSSIDDVSITSRPLSLMKNIIRKCGNLLGNRMSGFGEATDSHEGIDRNPRGGDDFERSNALDEARVSDTRDVPARAEDPGLDFKRKSAPTMTCGELAGRKKKRKKQKRMDEISGMNPHDNEVVFEKGMLSIGVGNPQRMNEHDTNLDSLSSNFAQGSRQTMSRPSKSRKSRPITQARQQVFRVRTVPSHASPLIGEKLREPSTVKAKSVGVRPKAIEPDREITAIKPLIDAFLEIETNIKKFIGVHRAVCLNGTGDGALEQVIERIRTENEQLILLHRQPIKFADYIDVSRVLDRVKKDGLVGSQFVDKTALRSAVESHVAGDGFSSSASDAHSQAGSSFHLKHGQVSSERESDRGTGSSDLDHTPPIVPLPHEMVSSDYDWFMKVTEQNDKRIRAFVTRLGRIYGERTPEDFIANELHVFASAGQETQSGPVRLFYRMKELKRLRRASVPGLEEDFKWTGVPPLYTRGEIAFALLKHLHRCLARPEPSIGDSFLGVTKLGAEFTNFIDQSRISGDFDRAHSLQLALREADRVISLRPAY